MSLNKEFFNRETNITAKVVADSISESGQRITTLEVEYPRFIHGEVMTHRSLSKNSSSSRAIPINKMLEQIESNMAVPVYWGKNKSGMQAVEEVENLNSCEMLWTGAYDGIKPYVDALVENGLHKQIPNRLTEPFQMMKVVITGTDWDNFFNLRIHKDAQPEICMLAYKIYKAMEESKPVELKYGEWHLPYVQNDGKFGYIADQTILTLEEAVKYSSACCASVSYRIEGMTLEKADKIFDMLVKAEVIHASPFEHLATPVGRDDYNKGGCGNADSLLHDMVGGYITGVTHIRSDGTLCSGNLTGWISYRQQLPSNTCWEFDFENRTSMFD